jgi:hypothetical protein
MIEMKGYKKYQKLIVFIFTALIFTAAVPLFSACSINEIIKGAYAGEKESPELPQVYIDEKEISEIGKEEIDIEKSYDIEGEVDFIDETVRDPFRPFYVEEEDEEEKNVFMLESIYIEDGIEYAELNFNDYLYKLKEGDPLGHIYSVQAINETSVVLLKGDDVLTVYIDQVKYD